MRKLGLALGLLAGVAFVSTGMAGDGYGDKKLGDIKYECSCPSNTARTVAWCVPCSGGVAFGHQVKSEKLVTALAGHEAKEDGIKCSGCKTAFKNSADCDHCKLGFRHGFSFHSPVSLALARGDIVDASTIECPRCKTIAEKGKGECTGCKVGMVASLMFKDKEDFKSAKKANTILAKAVKTATKCEGCAVAMVSDGTCDGCKISFKEGKKVTESRGAKTGSG